MAGSNPLRGLIIDLVTPFRENGDIDGRGLGQLLDRALPHVQAVLLASPNAGEGRDLNHGQREELLDKALVVNRGRVPILFWITQETEQETKETLTLLEGRLQKRDYKAQVFWVDTPLFYHSNRGLPLHYRNLAVSSKVPGILHNDPEFIRRLGRPLKRNNIRTSILKELAKNPDLQGLIFNGNLDRVGNYHRAIRTRADFKIYDGDESQFLNHPSRSGVVSIGANLAPKAWQKITSSSLQLDDNHSEYPNRLQQILEAGSYIRDLREVYVESPVPLIKQVLSERGLIESPTCTSKVEDIEDKSSKLNELMVLHGD